MLRKKNQCNFINRYDKWSSLSQLETVTDKWWFQTPTVLHSITKWLILVTNFAHQFIIWWFDATVPIEILKVFSKKNVKDKSTCAQKKLRTIVCDQEDNLI
jgi:hypothetical protein